MNKKYSGNNRARDIHKKHIHSSKNSKGTVEGTLSVTMSGLGFVDCPTLTEDIRVDSSAFGGAFHGDTVRVSYKTVGDRTRGEIIEVIKRARTELTGTIEADRGFVFVVPDDQKFHADIILAHEGVGDATPGDKVLVHIDAWGGPNESPTGAVIRVLGKSGEHEAETAALVLSHGFDISFPADALQEAKEIAENERTIKNEDVKDRRDFRGVPTITIDPFDAKDFDDALSLQTLPNGDLEIGVHIADVSYYIRPGSALEASARKRATSVYLPDRTVPMLPHELSNDLCSLTPGDEKRTVSAVFIFPKDGGEAKRWFGRTLIRSTKRFTYEEAEEILKGKPHELSPILKTLNTFAEKFRKEREMKGAIDFDTGEVKIIVENGKPVRMYRKERLAAHRLVEEWMLLANRAVAEEVFESHRGKPHEKFLYRIHDTPNSEKLADLAYFLKALGHTLILDKNGNASQIALQTVLKKLAGTPRETAARIAALRSMAKAIYTTGNKGHYGLAFDFYTHFTSPIRRFPDYIVHRTLLRHVAGQKGTSAEIDEYESIAKHATEREIAAAETEREAIKYFQAMYMTERIGQEFDGIITGVTDWGIFVAEKETGCEGLIRLSDLPGNGWEHEEKQLRLVNKTNGKHLSIGDTIKVRVVGANPKSKTIDYTPIEFTT